MKLGICVICGDERVDEKFNCDGCAEDKKFFEELDRWMKHRVGPRPEHPQRPHPVVNEYFYWQEDSNESDDL